MLWRMKKILKDLFINKIDSGNNKNNFFIMFFLKLAESIGKYVSFFRLKNTLQYITQQHTNDEREKG